MKSVSIETNWKYRNLETIIIENNLLKIIILPESGAKIFRLIHKPSDKNLLWENSQLIPRSVPFGASYDDNFFGGWDELFPNDEPITLNGEPYPDHGELWCQPWRFAIEEHTEKRVIVHLWCFGSVTNARVDKWLTVDSESPVLNFRHRIQNLGNNPIDFLWKLHPALSISANHRIDLPPCKILRVNEGWSDLIGEEQFSWPFCKGKSGGTVDLRKVLGQEHHCKEFVYGIDLEDGWCALTDTESRVGFGMKFPKEVFRSVWLFLSYGGWRGYYTAILEPCTAYPKELDKAIANGTCTHLEAMETLECEVEAVVYEGLQSVKNIKTGGEVVGE